MPVMIHAAAFPRSVEIMQIVVAYKEGDPLRMLPLLLNDILEPVESVTSIDILIWIRIDVVAEEYHVRISTIKHERVENVPVECSPMHVWHDIVFYLLVCCSFHF